MTTTSTSEGGLPCILKRRQFPLTYGWCLTINKAQGQSFKDKCGIALTAQVFSHGHLYVAFSRGSCFKNVGMYIASGVGAQGHKCDGNGDAGYYTANVVTKALLTTSRPEMKPMSAAPAVSTKQPPTAILNNEECVFPLERPPLDVGCDEGLDWLPDDMPLADFKALESKVAAQHATRVEEERAAEARSFPAAVRAPEADVIDVEHMVDNADLDMNAINNDDMPIDFAIQAIPGDGNCLFHALVAASGAVTTHMELRLAVVEYAMANPGHTFVGNSFVDWMNIIEQEDRRHRTYAQFMATNSVEGGTFEAHVAGIVLGVEVCISTVADRGWQHMGALGNERIYLNHLPRHYEVMRPR